MSIESFSPLPLNVFGSWVTLLDPSDVPPGMSPNLADVEFFPGGVRTRAGLASQFSPLAVKASSRATTFDGPVGMLMTFTCFEPAAVQDTGGDGAVK